jgi:hypothetical protein
MKSEKTCLLPTLFDLFEPRQNPDNKKPRTAVSPCMKRKQPSGLKAAGSGQNKTLPFSFIVRQFPVAR